MDLEGEERDDSFNSIMQTHCYKAMTLFYNALEIFSTHSFYGTGQ